MGLPSDALDFLRENEDVKVCQCCNQPFPPSLIMTGSYEGMYMAKYDLYEHKLKLGGCAVEFLQADPWSSGPCFFLGLRVFDKDGCLYRTFEWSQDEIDTC
jgi:hypothetical protein